MFLWRGEGGLSLVTVGSQAGACTILLSSAVGSVFEAGGMARSSAFRLFSFTTGRFLDFFVVVDGAIFSSLSL